jgi:hypothetical protein
MPIDVRTEELIRLEDAATFFPRSRRGKKISRATLFRYASRGLRCVVLETVQAGNAKCTSREAIGRFFARLTALANTPEPLRPADRKPGATRSLDERIFGAQTGGRRGAKGGGP